MGTTAWLLVANVAICLVAVGVGALLAPLPFDVRVRRFALAGVAAMALGATAYGALPGVRHRRARHDLITPDPSRFSGLRRGSGLTFEELEGGRFAPSANVAGPSTTTEGVRMTVLRTIGLFVVAAACEIGGAWLVWEGVREGRGLKFIAGGFVALAIYGLVATGQPDSNFGRVLAAYGGVFVAGSLAWGMVVDGFRPDRFDITGAVVCLLGVSIIILAPR